MTCLRHGGGPAATRDEGGLPRRARDRGRRRGIVAGAGRTRARAVDRPEGRRAAVLHRPGGRWPPRGRGRRDVLRPGCVGGRARPVRGRPLRGQGQRPRRRLAAGPCAAGRLVGQARRAHDDLRPGGVQAARLRRHPRATHGRPAHPGRALPRLRAAGVRLPLRRDRRRCPLPAGPGLRRHPGSAGAAGRVRARWPAGSRCADRRGRELARRGRRSWHDVHARRRVLVPGERERDLRLRGRAELRTARSHRRQSRLACGARAGGSGLASPGHGDRWRSRGARRAAADLPLRPERRRPARDRPDAAATGPAGVRCGAGAVAPGWCARCAADRPGSAAASVRRRCRRRARRRA